MHIAAFRPLLSFDLSNLVHFLLPILSLSSCKQRCESFLVRGRYRFSLFVPLQTHDVASPHARLLHFGPLAVSAQRRRIGKHNNPENTAVSPPPRFPRDYRGKSDIGFPRATSEIVSRAGSRPPILIPRHFPRRHICISVNLDAAGGRELSPEQFKTTWPCGMH